MVNFIWIMKKIEKIEKKKFLENKISTIDCFCAADKVQPVCVTFDSSAVGNTC